MAGPMMPPGGGAPHGGDIANQLMELLGPVLQSPKGQAMAQAVMAQMGGGGGGDPRAMMAQAGAGGGSNPLMGSPASSVPHGRGPITDGNLAEVDGANADMGVRPEQPALDMMGNRDDMMPDPRQTPQPMSTEDELAMAQQGMGAGPSQGGGGGGMNPDGPTPQEVQLLKSKPTPQNMQNFDKLFGQGAAEQALGGGTNLGTAPGSGTPSYEDDVNAAMDQGDDDGDSY